MRRRNNRKEEEKQKRNRTVFLAMSEHQSVTLIVIIIGGVLSLSMGFFEMIESIISSKPFGFSSVLLIFPPLAATICAFFLIYAVLWFLVISHIGRFFKLKSLPLALSFALFLVIGFISALLKQQIFFPRSFTQLFQLFVLFLLSLVPSIGLYFISKTGAPISKYRNITLAIPFVLAATMILVWISRYKMTSLLSVPFFLALGGYGLIVLFTVKICYHTGQKTRIVRSLAIFMLIVVLSPLVTLFARNVSLARIKKTDHQINKVILIIIDTLRPDSLSCYNPQDASTPHIDQLVRDGILFSHAISSAPWTLPSVASIMTGLSPLVHKVTRRTSMLPDTVRTLAEYMNDAGYYTAAIGRNGFLTPEYNIRQGFHDYIFFPNSGSSFGIKVMQQFSPSPSRFQANVLTDDITALTINWLEAHAEKDFFLWIHYLDPHLPYAPPPDFLPKRGPSPSIGNNFSRLQDVRGGYFVPSLVEREWIRELYNAEVRYVDKNIGELLDTLKRLNLYDESLIILTSDHGEEFWEHNGYEHGHTLYNEVLWVPLIIKPPRSSSHQQMSTGVPIQAIMPTILDLCGINYERSNLTVGSLSPLWRPNAGTFDEQPIVSTGLVYYEDRESVIFDGLKYIRSLLTDREELYNLVRDPDEQHSVTSLFPGKVQRARTILNNTHRIAKDLRKQYDITNEEEVKIDKETIQQLKSLGYMQ